VFHHLSPTGKRAALTEILRVLRPDGQFYLADFSAVPALLARTLYLPLRIFDGLQNTADNFYGRLPRLMSEAGFIGIRQNARFVIVLGPVSIVIGRKGSKD
jgi:SAM-dependent methyltransferase